MSGAPGTGLPAEDLRALVREVLLDVLPGLVDRTSAAAAPRVEQVRVRDDADLAAFAARVLAAADDVRSGRVVFSLADAASPAAVAAPGSSAPSGPTPVPASGHHVERGAVTERHVRAAEAAGGRLVLGPRAVLTPLARDRARAKGVEIVRPSDPGRS